MNLTVAVIGLAAGELEDRLQQQHPKDANNSQDTKYILNVLLTTTTRYMINFEVIATGRSTVRTRKKMVAARATAFYHPRPLAGRRIHVTFWTHRRVIFKPLMTKKRRVNPGWLEGNIDKTVDQTRRLEGGPLNCKLVYNRENHVPEKGRHEKDLRHKFAKE